ncbi:MAG: nitrilase-related carbon-nitrogen hydrolase [Deferribacterota bacterium]|nr:nitrilase-related carbon-nitrogen hydrolase [Deferribacterota bacterium]
MMKHKIYISQFRPILGDINKNLETHRTIIEKAIEEGCDLVIFPELSLTGYCLRDLTYDVAINENDSIFKPLLQLSNKISIILGFVYIDENHLAYNASAFLEDGGFKNIHKKVFLPDYTMFEEGRYFAGGRKFKVFDTKFGKTVILICEDALNIITIHNIFRKEVSFIVIVSNSPARGVYKNDFYSRSLWYNTNRFISMGCSSYVTFVNRVGVEEGITFWGGSMIFDPFGTLLHELPLFENAYKECELDLSAIKRARISSPFHRNIDKILED